MEEKSMKKLIALILVLTLVAALFCGCNGQEEPTPAQTEEQNSPTTEQPEVLTEGLTFADPIPAPEEITTFGPDGKTATWYTELELTPDELAQVRSMNLTACFELINASEWDNANLIGFTEACEAMDLDVCAPTFDPLWQAGVKLDLHEQRSYWLHCWKGICWCDYRLHR